MKMYWHYWNVVLVFQEHRINLSLTISVTAWLFFFFFLFLLFCWLFFFFSSSSSVWPRCPFVAISTSHFFSFLFLLFYLLCKNDHVIKYGRSCNASQIDAWYLPPPSTAKVILGRNTDRVKNTSVPWKCICKALIVQVTPKRTIQKTKQKRSAKYKHCIKHTEPY